MYLLTHLAGTEMLLSLPRQPRKRNEPFTTFLYKRTWTGFRTKT